jgi:lipid A 3-O-deacylase
MAVAAGAQHLLSDNEPSRGQGAHDMTRRLAWLILPVLLAWLPAAPADAQNRFVDEVKVGVLGHDLPFLGGQKEGGADINAEILFTSPAFLRRVWAPRPHIGGSVNTNGDTNHAYIGLTWEFTLAREIARRNDAIFFGFSLGGAVHDGLLDTRRTDRKSLGSRALFRESVEVGYRLNEIHSLSAYVDHISNARLAKRNEGITNAGMRLGLKF